jgi:hypothetical protein
MSNWILINKFEVANANAKSQHGSVRTMLPPHLIPEAVKADVDNGVVVLHFRYDTISEPHKEKPVNGGVLVVGETTGRVYEIRMQPNPAAKAANKEKASLYSRLFPQSLEGVGDSGFGAFYSLKRYSNELDSALAVAF